MHSELIDDRGQGPGVIYVPGIDGTGAYLLDNAERIRRDFRLLRIRHLADDDPARDTYDHLAGSIGRIIAEHSDGPVIVLAESFGVGVALQLALDAPELVAGLLLVNGFAYHPWRLRLRWTQFAASMRADALTQALRPRAAGSALFGKRLNQKVLAAFLEVPFSGMDDGYKRRLEMIRGLDLRPRLHAIQQPTTLVASGQDLIVPSVEAGQVMAEGLPNARLTELPGSGHLVLPLEDEPWVERLQELVQRSQATRDTD